jgi:hypothetical protein
MKDAMLMIAAWCVALAVALTNVSAAAACDGACPTAQPATDGAPTFSFSAPVEHFVTHEVAQPIVTEKIVTRRVVQEPLVVERIVAQPLVTRKVVVERPVEVRRVVQKPIVVREFRAPIATFRARRACH